MMLSSIGRAAIRRVSAGASHQSTNRVFQSILHLQRVARSSNVDSTFILRPSSLSLLRSYATASLKTKPKTKTSAAKAKPKTKTAAAKKPVKKPLKSKPKRKVAAKPKPKAKPKRKVLTDKQKEKAAKEKQTAALKALKATALSPPKGKPANTWAVLLAEFVTKGIAGGGHIGSLAKEASVKYKSLTTEEKEVREEPLSCSWLPLKTRF
jgi:outer membrane biosynthesis protein TonB